MKKQIVNPNIRIVRFGAADIIVTSPDYDPQSEFDNERHVTTPARTTIFDQRSGEKCNASHYLQQFIYSDDMEMRVVNAYDSHGNLQGEAEFNHGAGGAFIKMICAYRKHD